MFYQTTANYTRFIKTTEKNTCEGWPLVTPIGSKQLTWSKFQALAALVTVTAKDLIDWIQDVFKCAEKACP